MHSIKIKEDRLKPVLFSLSRAYLLGTSRRFLGLAVEQCGGRSDGYFVGQAPEMGRRVLLQQCGTQRGALDYNSGHIEFRRLRVVDELPRMSYLLTATEERL